jgi:hypothetical protein
MKRMRISRSGASKLLKSQFIYFWSLDIILTFMPRGVLVSVLFRHKQLRFTVLKRPTVKEGHRFPTVHVRCHVDQRGAVIDAMFSGIQLLKKYVSVYII